MSDESVLALGPKLGLPSVLNLAGLTDFNKQSGGIGVPDSKLLTRAIGTRGEAYALEGSAVSASAVKNFGRTREYIGARARTLRLVFTGYWLEDTGEIAASNAYTVRAALEINGQTRPLTFGGNASGIVASGEAFVESDEITADQFGLKHFEPGTLVWRRVIREVATGEKMMYKSATPYTTPIANETFLTAALDADEALLTGTGAVSAGNGWTAASHMWFPAALVGKKSDKTVSIGIAGASIEDGVGDNPGDGSNNGGGGVRRALSNLKLPRISVAKGGESMAVYVASSTRRRALLQRYCEVVGLGQVGNDYTLGATVQTALTRVRNGHALTKGGAVERTFQIAAAPKSNRINSGIGWLESNQVPRTGFDKNGAWRDVFNNTVKSESGWGNPIDLYVDIGLGYVGQTKQDVWGDNLVADGTHPTPQGHTNAAVLLTDWFDALEQSWRNGQIPVLPEFPLPAPQPQAPVATQAPVVSGNPKVGNQLTVTPGTYTGLPAPTITRQWYLDSQPINGATGLTYTPVEADIGKQPHCVERAENEVGFILTDSNALAAITAASAGGYRTESEVIFAQRTDLSTAKKQAVNDLIAALVDSGAYAKADVIQIYRIGLFNCKDPTKYNASLLGAATRTDAAGLVTTAAASSYGDTGYNPSTANGNMQSFNASVFIGIAAGGVANASSVAGFYDGAKGITFAPHTGTNLTFRINSAASKTLAQSNANGGNGIFSSNRSEEVISDFYSNGVHHPQVTDTYGAALANGNLRMGSISGTASVARTFDFFMAGASLTEAQHLAVHTAYNTFKTAYANAA